MPRFFTTLLFLFSLISFQLKAQLVDYWHKNEAQPRMDSLMFIFQHRTLYLDSTTAFAEIKGFKQATAQTPEFHFLAKFFEAYYYGGGLERNVPKSLPLFLQNLAQIRKYDDWKPLIQCVYAFNLQAVAAHYFMHEKGLESRALHLYLKSDSVYKKIGYDNAVGSFQALTNIGDFYLRMKEYTLALDYLQRAGYYIDKESWNWFKINYYNDLGLCLSKLGYHEQAIATFQKIAPHIVNPLDSVWIGLLNGNIGSEYYKMGRGEEAEKYLLIDYQYSARYKEACSALGTLNELININTQLGRLNRVKHYLGLAEYWTLVCKNPELKYEFLRKQSTFYYQTKNYKKALEVRILADSLSDSLAMEAQKQQIWEQTQAYEAKQKENSLKLLEQDKEYATLQRNFLFFAIIALSGLAFFVYRTMRLNAQRQQSLFAHKQLELDRERQEALLELHSFKDNINQKNKVIEHFQRELASLKAEQQKENYEAALQQLEQPSFVTQQDWVQFSKAFEKAYPYFLENLQKSYPQITPAETRLLVLTKLQFSGKEIAAALGVSLDAVHKSRYRLRKKLNLPEEDNFANLIEEVSGLV